MPSIAELRVSRAGPGEAVPIHALLERCGAHLAATHGLTNWLPPYPLTRLHADIASRHVFSVHARDVLVATFTLGHTPVVATEPSPPWADPAAPATYVNRLAVDPARQAGGIGGWCTGWIERHAATGGSAAVRLDALAANRLLLRFYDRHGYVRRGTRSHSGFEFVCYEKCLPRGETITR